MHTFRDLILLQQTISLREGQSVLKWRAQLCPELFQPRTGQTGEKTGLPSQTDVAGMPFSE